MATIYAYDQLNFDTLNLNRMVVGAIAADKYGPVIVNGIYYPTVLEYDYVYGGSTYYTGFGGLSLNYNSITKVPISGTVTGIIQYQTSFGVQYTIEQISVSAITLYNAAKTSATTDDLTILTNALAGNDFIYGGNYNDKLYGYAGNDFLNGGGGADILIGGLGNDTYVVDNIGDVLTELASQGTDNVQSSVTYTLASNIENLTLTGSSSINAYGNSLNNIINGNSGNNILSGNGGTDNLNGGAGNDQYNFTAGIGSATILDTSGIDTLSFDARPFASLTYGIDINRAGTNNINLVVTVSQGSSKLQTLTVSNAYQAGALGSGALESLSLIGSTETISYSSIHGLSGSSSNELIVGFATNDTLTGSGGRDLLAGGAGNDNITGGSGDDTLIGGTGIDTFRIDSGTDEVYDLGRGGADIINVSSGATGAFLLGSAWTATASSINNGTAGIVTNGLAVNLSAITSGNGFVVANIGAATTLTGSALADLIQGGSGNDTIIGGGGMDFISSGLGNDSLTGGLGSDYFIFDSVLNASTNRDTITDFSHADDTIGLSKAIFTAFSAQSAESTLLSNQFWSNTTGLAHDADDRIIYNTSTGGIFYDSNGSATGGAIQIALLSSRPVGIDYTDFMII